jgi:nucleotide-binding universal stress UspA family protein
MFAISEKRQNHPEGETMKFLVGYDGSNCAKDALDLAGKHAKAFGAELIVVTSLGGGSGTDTDQVQQAEAGLALAETSMKDNGVDVETHLLVRGLNPGEDVVKYAEENRVDAIFIGVRRRSKVGKLLSGSNAQYIILKAPCPVMTIK